MTTREALHPMSARETQSGRLPRWPRLSTLAAQPAPSALALLLIVAAVLQPSFYSGSNVVSLLEQASILGIVTVGQTFVLLGRGLDLSVGAVMGLSATVVTQVSAHGTGIALAVAAALGVSAAIGLLNAWLVVRRSVAPFIATLGTFILVDGLRTAYTQGSTSGSAPGALRHLALGSIGPVPSALLVWLGIAALALAMLRHSLAGRWLYASGGNPRTSRLSGVPVAPVVAATYVVAALLACVGGLMQAGFTGYVDQYLGSQVQLTSITAALIGGVTFAGGRGGIGGPVAGALLLTALANLIVLLNLSTADEAVVTGAVLLLAVALQGFRLAQRSGRVAIRELLPPLKGG